MAEIGRALAAGRFVTIQDALPAALAAELAAELAAAQKEPLLALRRRTEDQRYVDAAGAPVPGPRSAGRRVHLAEPALRQLYAPLRPAAGDAGNRSSADGAADAAGAAAAPVAEDYGAMSVKELRAAAADLAVEIVPGLKRRQLAELLAQVGASKHAAGTGGGGATGSGGGGGGVAAVGSIQWHACAVARRTPGQRV